MGNRTQIICNGVSMYSHWDGPMVTLKVIERALAKAPDRWSDPSYLARIIFSELIKESIDETTGYGLSGNLNSSNPTYLVDCHTQTVWFLPDGYEEKSAGEDLTPMEEAVYSGEYYSFGEVLEGLQPYIALYSYHLGAATYRGDSYGGNYSTATFHEEKNNGTRSRTNVICW